MKRISKFLLQALRPHIAVIIALIPISGAFTIYIFATQRETTIAGIISHALAAYTLAVAIINIRKIAVSGRWLINHSRPGSAARSAIYSNKHTAMYMKDKAYRAKVALYVALAMNVIFAVLKLLGGIYYASVWYGADAFFYIVLSGANFFILRFVRKSDTDKELEDEYRLYRFCGIFIFVLVAALVGLVVQIVYQNMTYTYPDILIFLVATYAFACLVTAIVNVFSYRKLGSPALSAAKAIRLARALVAIFALQTAMLNTFADESFAAYQALMNALTGGGICLFLLGMAIFMVRSANKNLKLLREG